MECENRNKILQRILNLRQKADNAASSEAEMNTAFNLCQKLMDSYNVEEAELALAETQGKIKLDIISKKTDASSLKGKKQQHKVIYTLRSIAYFTETKYVFWRRNGDVEFTGHRPDVELANYLMSVIKTALDAEYDHYRKLTPAVGYGAKTSFQISMANRINRRLVEMKNNQTSKLKEEVLKLENSETASSTALVILQTNKQKKIEIEEAFKKANPKIRNTNLSNRTTNGTAHQAGRAAGNKVHLGKAIQSGSLLKIAS